MNTTSNPSLDIEQVKAEFESWRITRRGKQHIPHQLWDKAVALLSNYSVGAVSRKLRLDRKQLKKRLSSSSNGINEPACPKRQFVEIDAKELSASISRKATQPQKIIAAKKSAVAGCQIIFERTDGSRLSFDIPADPALLSALCAGLLKPLL